MEELTPYVGGSIVVAALLIGFLKKYIKDYLVARWGDSGVLLVLLAIALVLSLIGYIWGMLPANITGAIYAIFSTAIVIYQVLYKAIFKKVICGKVDADEK